MHYSADLTRLIGTMLEAGSPGGIKEVRQLTGLLGDHLWNEMDATRAFSDALHRDLAMELENGRLFRLMVKIGASPPATAPSSCSHDGPRQTRTLTRGKGLSGVLEKRGRKLLWLFGYCHMRSRASYHIISNSVYSLSKGSFSTASTCSLTCSLKQRTCLGFMFDEGRNK